MSRLNRALASVAMVLLLGTPTVRADTAADGTTFKGRTEQMVDKSDFNQLLALPAGKEVVATTDGDKQTDVHLFVYDDAETLVGQDTSPGPLCNVTFTPIKAGIFKFVVKNEGPGTNNVTLKVTVAK